MSSIFDSKGVGCAKYEGISVNPCKRYKLEIDSVEENNKEKGEREKRKRQGEDKDQTRERRRSDKDQTEKKIWTIYVVHI